MNGIDQLKRKVKSHSCAPVIALSGDERALIDEALFLIRHSYLISGAALLNHQKFSAAENDAPDLMTALLTMPFLASHRLVEVHNAERLDPSLIASLIAYMEKPSPSTLLVLLFSKADKRNKLLAELEKRGDHFVFLSLNFADRRQYLVEEAAAHNLSFSANALDVLLAVTDGDLLSLKNALEKLALLGQEITVDHIEQHVMATSLEDVFVTARAISEGRLVDSLISLGRLRNSDENAIKFLGVLCWQFRVLVHIRACLEHNMPDFDIRKEVGVFGDRFSWMMQIAKKRTMDFHIDRLTKLVECDRALKTGAVLEPFHVLERFVYQSANFLENR